VTDDLARPTHTRRKTFTAVILGLTALLLSVVLAGLRSWTEGMNGVEVAVVLLAYASVSVLITWRICGALLPRNAAFDPGEVLDVFKAALDEFDPRHPSIATDPENGLELIETVFRRGVPLVAEIIPARRIVVVSRNETLGCFTPVLTWPVDNQDVSELAELPQLDEALSSGSATLDGARLAVPVGYDTEGELVMLLEGSELEEQERHRTLQTAELIASVFVRSTSKVNFTNRLNADRRTDSLTGLANRVTLYERIEIEMAHALRAETTLSVAMIDLDHFKDYNDRFGQVAGDTVLRGIAALMVSNIRGQDLVARFGGEEFCLVMPETDLVGGHHLLEKLRSGGREATSDFGVTLSAGLTSWDGFESVTSFIERADQALDRAKETGRDRVVSIQAFTEF
jgi:diguanylate cyclase (GGDEF)-like protein